MVSIVVRSKSKASLRLALILLVATLAVGDATIHSASSRASSSLTSSNLLPNSSNNNNSKLVSSSKKASVGVQDLVVEARGGAVVAVQSNPTLHNLKIGGYFALWYALNIVYNILNKKLLNTLPAPLTVGSLQFGVGAIYVGLLWLFKLRAAPTLTPAGKKAVTTVGFWHCTGQLASMVSLGAGPVSFTHIVKALEPFFSALVSAIFFGKWMKPQVYATLIPVVGGVGYACLKERSFSWLAFSFAMASNVAFALRAVLSKVAMTGTGIGTNLTSPNIFGLVTWAAFIISIPMALLGEGSAFGGQWKTALETMQSQELIKALVVSGMFHYLNNEVMYLALGNVHPVTLAVGNTMKRVFIMVASVMVFRNDISLQAGIGSFVGISGVLLYSLTKQHYEKIEQQESKSSKRKRVQ